jgi:hypothetical protein
MVPRQALRAFRDDSSCAGVGEGRVKPVAFSAIDREIMFEIEADG